MSEQLMSLDEAFFVSKELTTEAMSFQGAFDQVRKVMPEFFSKVKSFFAGVGFANEQHLSLFNDNMYRKLSGNGDYVSLRLKPVMVPKGLKVTYKAYLAVLSDAQRHMDGLLSNRLIPFEKYLADLLTNPDTMRSERLKQPVVDINNKSMETIKKSIAACFHKDNAEFRTYGNLLERQSDWSTIAQKYNDILERHLLIRRTEVIEQIEISTGHINTLLKRMEEDPNAYQMNGINAKSLAEQTLALAREVEFYAAFGFMLETLQTSIENAVEIARKG